MIDKEKATKIADQQIASIGTDSGIDVKLLPEETVEFELGWIFFWDSKKYLETRDFSDALAGNSPIIVDKYDGSVHQTSTALGTAKQLIEWYRHQRGSRR